MEQTWATKELEPFSTNYYAACAFSGMISTGSVHLLVTPFDMLKVNMQANPEKYTSVLSSFGIVYREQGLKGIWKGWGSKLYGFSFQGACKFCLYEYFKRFYSGVAGSYYIRANKTSIYAASSLSAQIIADTALCPFESIKVRVQRGYAKGLTDGLPRLYCSEGFTGLYKGTFVTLGTQLTLSVNILLNLPKFLHYGTVARGLIVCLAVAFSSLWIETSLMKQGR
uniref:ADP,ATP carrier protein n=1 Tax=Physcomitrium patens TaxID=3218 RepID=A0A2K1ICF2_PHYPA|nr:hypothetical protein PHYPA_030432 [Physcomitrium patens]